MPVWLPIELVVGLVALVAYDLLKIRRVHPGTLAGSGAYMLTYVVLITILSTDATRTFVLGLLP